MTATAPAATALPDARASDLRAEHRLGVLLCLAAAVSWSVSGVFARLLAVDVWTASCLRAACGTLYMAAGTLLVHRGGSLRAVRRMGWRGPVVAVFGSVSMLAFVAAFYTTSVADVAVIYSTTPFLAAGFAWLLLRERVEGRTLVASLAALAGVGVMMAASLGSGHLVGDAWALLMAASFAVVAVLVRLWRGLEMLPVNMVICLGAALLALPFAHPMSAGPRDLAILAAFSFTSTPLAFFLFLAGTRRIPAAEAGLITTLDVVLSPLWVFVLFGENPGALALAGGAVVLAAVLGHIGGSLQASAAGRPRDGRP